MTARTRISKTALRVAGLTALALGSLAAMLAREGLAGGPLRIESLESRTRGGDAVFNRIAWFPGAQQDVWMMQQSHHGVVAPDGQWDRLAIVVDKTARPRVARFYQLAPGALAWTPGTRQVPYRAACFTCHSNGPRAIRPVADSSAAPLSLRERARVLAWNLRIKTYGRVVAAPEMARVPGPVPFRYAGADDNRPLTVASCTRCHNEAWWGRGTLTRQNMGTIEFMVERGQMPPPGAPVSPADRHAITRFLKGLPL